MQKRLKAAWHAFVNYVDEEKLAKKNDAAYQRKINSVLNLMPERWQQFVRDTIKNGRDAELDYQAVTDFMDWFASDQNKMGFEDKYFALTLLARAHYRFSVHRAVSGWVNSHTKELAQIIHR